MPIEFMDTNDVDELTPRIAVIGVGGAGGNAIANIANAKQILGETIQYCKDRKAFGQPIGCFQHNKFKLAEMVTAIEVAEAYIDDCIAAHADEVIYLPATLELVSPILNVVALQLLAYETAARLGRDVDQPRNLAKSVTVE